MSKIKYQSKVTQLGSLSGEFINEGILVFFQEDVPEELVEISILHQHKQLHEEVRAGDTLIIGDQSMPVLCVGEVANQNLANLGHLVVKFNGLTKPEMPGDVSVPGDTPMPSIIPGTVIKIISED